MRSLYTYIQESYDDFLKLSPEDKKHLLELDLEYGKIMLISRYETTIRTIDNLDEEWEKFNEQYIQNREKYFPILKYPPLEYEKYDLENRVNDLIIKFRQFHCPLSRYYILSLNNILNKIELINSINNNTYQISDEKIHSLHDDILDKAFDIARNQSFESVKDLARKDKDYERNITGEKIKTIIRDALDDLGYDWEIVTNNTMPPRMGVNPEKTFRIRTTAKFSNVDVDTLIAHEIKAHVAKRYYGYQTGLFLFVFGLQGRNTLDEGLAIWNSLNLTKKNKPYELPAIALSYIACHYASKYDFCECFDKLKTLYEGQPVSDKRLFKQLMRLKRTTGRTDLLGFWSGDKDYLEGYLIIDRMSTEERQKVLKWNVGEMDYYNIPMFEKFIAVNDFKPISNSRLKLITKDYKFKY